MRSVTVVLVFVATVLAVAAAPAWADLQIPPVTYPKLAAHAASAEAFVPRGWTLEVKRGGDLNGDGKPDLVLVIKDADARNVIPNDAMGPNPFDTNPRILAVAFAAAAGGYDLVLQNHTLIPRPEYPNMEDPLDPKGIQAGGVEIKGGTLRVTLGLFSSAGSWSMGHKSYVLRWQDGAFRLIGYDANETRRNTGEITDVSINFSTGRMSTTKNTMETDVRGKPVWTTLPKRPLLAIEAIGNGMEYEPPAE